MSLMVGHCREVAGKGIEGVEGALQIRNNMHTRILFTAISNRLHGSKYYTFSESVFQADYLYTTTFCTSDSRLFQPQFLFVLIEVALFLDLAS